MKTIKNKALIITSAENRYWLRCYHRRHKILALCNFVPSAYPTFINELEHLVCLDSMTNYIDANMGVFIFTVTKGIPLVSIQNALSKLSNIEPMETTHHGTPKEPDL